MQLCRQRNGHKPQALRNLALQHVRALWNHEYTRQAWIKVKMELDGGQMWPKPIYTLLLQAFFGKKKPSNVSNTSSAQDSKLCGEEPKSLAPWPRALESKGSTTAVSQFTDHGWIWGCLKFGIHFVPWTSSCSSFSALKLPFGGISNCRIAVSTIFFQ